MAHPTVILKKCALLALLYAFLISQAAAGNAIDKAIPIDAGNPPFENMLKKARSGYQIGEYDTSVAQFKGCVSYFDGKDIHSYFTSLYYLGLSYFKTGEYGQALVTAKRGIAEGAQLDYTELACYFHQLKGIIAFTDGNYDMAIEYLNSALPKMILKKDFDNIALTDAYLGKSYWSLNQKEKAVPHFKVADSLFRKQGHMHPDLRESYEKLIEFYGLKNDSSHKLYYVNQLLKVDEALKRKYPGLLSKTPKQYNESDLRQMKAAPSNALPLAIGLPASALLLFLGIFYYRKRKHPSLLQSLFPSHSSSEKDSMTAPLEIGGQAKSTILQKLEQFEQQKRYLEKDMNPAKLVLFLETNTKYAAAILQEYRSKKLLEYISDLRIDHSIALLKNERKYRNYSDKALSEEAGFRSGHNFSRVFKARTGMTRAEFVQKL
jgi:AraC-like DNA-binding protein